MSFFRRLLGAKKGGAGAKERRVSQATALADARALLAEKLAGDGKTVEYEFERLRRGDAPMAVAEAPENEGRNRYVNVLPFDANRVALADGGGGGSDYINASLLASKPGEAPAWQYIATQGPLGSTVEDFWLMVLQQRSDVVVMLTRTRESAHLEKCASYFAEEQGGTVQFGRFAVTTASVADLHDDITVRELRLADAASGEARSVLHYHYHAWPDHGVPRTTAPLRRLSELLRRARPAGPPVVHCSAGIGRTGTFCVVDIVLRRLQALDGRGAGGAERAVDLRRVVAALRRQRTGMVQTPGQYLFCHQAVKEEIEQLMGMPDASLSSAIALSPSE